VPKVELDDLIGKPFKDGGRGPEAYDCWGVVLEVFARFGIELPDYKICAFEAAKINEQIDACRNQWEPVEHPATKDAPLLVVIRNDPVFCNHTGVYAGYGKFIHILNKTHVIIDRLDHPLWRKRIEGLYRWRQTPSTND